MNMIKKKQQIGVALMTMIFILVVIGSAVVFMARLSLTQNATTNQAVQSARAKYAALTGIYWMAYHLNWVGGVKAVPTTPGNCPGSTTTSSSVTLPTLAGDLAGFTVLVDCVRNDYQEGGSLVNNVFLYTITSTAQYGVLGDADYAYKQMSVVMERQ